MTKLGTAFIEIRPDTKGFPAELRQKLKAAASGIQSDVDVGADARGLRGEVTRAAKAAELGQKIEVPVRADTRQATGLLAAYHDTVGKAVKETALLSSTIQLIKFPAMIAGITQAVSALGALTAGTVAATFALGPLTGFLGAIPQLGLAAAQGIATVKLATSDLKDATKLLAQTEKAGEAGAGRIAEARRNLSKVQREAAEQIANDGNTVESANKRVTAAQEALTKAQEAAGKANKEVAAELAKLSPAAVSFARTLETLKPQVKDLKEAAASGLFPGVEEGIKRASVLMPTLQVILKETGQEIGNITKRFADLATSPAFAKDIRTLGAANAQVIQRFGSVSLLLTDAFRHVAVAAIPLVDVMGRASARFALYVRDAAAAGRESGRMAGFFERTVETGRLLFDTLRNVGRMLLNIGKAASPLGKSLLESLEASTEKLARFTGSTEGQNKLKAFFDAARPTLHEIALLIRDISSALAGMAINPGTAAFISQLRTELLPVLVEILNTSTQDFSSGLVSLLAAAARIFSLLSTESGALIRVIELLENMLQLFFNVTNAVPGLDKLVVAILTFGAALKAINFVGALTGVTQLISAFKAVRLTAAGATGAVGGLQAVLTKFGPGLAITAVVGAALTAQSAFTNAKRSAQELVEEINKKIDFTSLASINKGLDENKAKFDKALESSRGWGNAIKGGLQSVIPGITKTIINASGAASALVDQQLALTQQAGSLKAALRSVSQSTGLTSADVSALAKTMSVDLTEGGILASSRIILAFDEMARRAGFASGTAARAAGVTVEGLTSMAKAADDMRASIGNSFSSATNIVQGLGNEVDITAAKVLEFYRSNEEKARAFRDNINELLKTDLNPAIIAEIAQAGPILGGGVAAATLQAVREGGAAAINGARENTNLLATEVKNVVAAALRDAGVGAATAGASVGDAFVAALIGRLNAERLRTLIPDVGNILESKGSTRGLNAGFSRNRGGSSNTTINNNMTFNERVNPIHVGEEVTQRQRTRR